MAAAPLTKALRLHTSNPCLTPAAPLMKGLRLRTSSHRLTVARLMKCLPLRTAKLCLTVLRLMKDLRPHTAANLRLTAVRLTKDLRLLTSHLPPIHLVRSNRFLPPTLRVNTIRRYLLPTVQSRVRTITVLNIDT
jgi:hypothetical protein